MPAVKGMIGTWKGRKFMKCAQCKKKGVYEAYGADVIGMRYKCRYCKKLQNKPELNFHN